MVNKFSFIYLNFPLFYNNVKWVRLRKSKASPMVYIIFLSKWSKLKRYESLLITCLYSIHCLLSLLTYCFVLSEKGCVGSCTARTRHHSSCKESMLLSETMPTWVKKLARKYLLFYGFLLSFAPSIIWFSTVFFSLVCVTWFLMMVRV